MGTLVKKSTTLTVNAEYNDNYAHLDMTYQKNMDGELTDINGTVVANADHSTAGYFNANRGSDGKMNYSIHGISDLDTLMAVSSSIKDAVTAAENDKEND